MTEKTVNLNGPDHPDFILDDYPLYNLNRTSATYIERMSEELKKVNMDQPSWRVLMLLADKNPSTVGDLSRRSVTKISTITRILMRMENEGLVKRQPYHKDNRVIEVHILEGGIKILSELRRLANEVYKEAFVGISDNDMITFTNMLMKITENLGKNNA
jgi:DNA-binding MarR family transcriptional regulator